MPKPENASHAMSNQDQDSPLQTDPEFKERYINPFTDYGFKKLFGEVVNKDLLIDFLNELLKEEQGNIVDLTYLKTEHLGSTETDRKAIFDLYCTNQRGEKFIVELQKTKQNFFKDRSVYYSTFPIQEQAKRGEWDFNLKAVYTVAILDFVFEEDKHDTEKYRYDVKLSDIETQKVFYDKLTFIYLEMPKFKKNLEQLENRFEKWLYLLRNLHRLSRIPVVLQEKIFEQAFRTAEIARFTSEQRLHYEDSLKYYRDLKNSIDTAFDDGDAMGFVRGLVEGEEIGLAKGQEIGSLNARQEIARSLLDLIPDNATLAAKTGLSAAQVQALRNEGKSS